MVIEVCYIERVFFKCANFGVWGSQNLQLCCILTPVWLFRFFWDVREYLYLFWTHDSLFWLESLHPSLCFDSQPAINLLCVISACSQIPHVMLCLTVVWKHVFTWVGSRDPHWRFVCVCVFVQGTTRLNQALLKVNDWCNLQRSRSSDWIWSVSLGLRRVFDVASEGLLLASS